MQVRIRFWWPGYMPEKALTSLDAEDTPFEVSRDGGKTWRPPHNGSTLQTVHHWMTDHDLEIVRTALADKRRRDRWEGQYVLTIAPNGNGSAQAKEAHDA